MKNQASNVIDITTPSPIGLEHNTHTNTQAPMEPALVYEVDQDVRDNIKNLCQEFVIYYIKTFKEIYGYYQNYSAKEWNIARNSVKQIIEQFGTNKTKEYAQLFLENPPSWNRDNFTLRVWHFVSALDKIILREKDQW